MQHRIVNLRKGHEEFYNGNSWTRKYNKAKVYEITNDMTQCPQCGGSINNINMFKILQ